MADVVIIHAEVDTGDSASELAAVEKGIDDVVGASEGMSEVDKRFEALNKKVNAGGLSIRDMTKAVKEYQTIAMQAGQDSPIGQEAIKRAAEMKDEVGDLNAKVNALAHDGRNMQAALQLGGVIVSGYTAFQSVTAMLGAENEDLLKVISKLQAAQGALAAIEQVRAALEKESFLMLKLKNIQLQLQNKNLGQLAVQLLKNPWTIAAVGVVALGTAIYNLITRETEYEKAVRLSKKATEEAIQQLDRRTKLAVRGIDDEINSLRASGKETFEQEKYKQELIIRTSETRLKLLKRQRDAEQAAFDAEIQEMVQRGGIFAGAAEVIIKETNKQDSEIFKSRKALNDQIVQAEQENHDAIQALKNLELSKQKEQNDKAVENYRAAKEEQKKIDEEYDKKRKADREEFEKADAEVRALREAKAVKIAEDQNQKLFDIQKAKFDAEQELLRLQEAAEREQFELRLDHANRILQNTETGLNAAISLERSIFEITNNLGKQDEKSKLDRAKRQFNIQKGVNIAEAGIDGAKAVTKAIAQYGPPPSPLGILGIASAAAITGLQIAAIASKRFDGGGAGGNAPSLPSSGTGGAGGSEFIPRNENTTQTAGLVGQGNNVPVQQVVVLDSELHAVRERNQMIEVRSTI